MPASTASSASTAPAPIRSAITYSTATSGTARSIWTRAVVHSCDIYFYEMCRRVGAEKLAPMVRSMGFGEKFDLPFDNQRYGTIPDPEWMMRKYHREWQTYDTINMSIGQGMVLINPLQLAVMASRLATGKRVVPRLLKNKPVVPQTQLAVDQDHLDFHPQRDGGRRRSRHRRRRQAAARRHSNGGQDRHRPDSQSRAPDERGRLHGSALEAARPLAVHGLRAGRQSALRRRRDRRAWRFRRVRRGAAGARHADCFCSTSKRRSPRSKPSNRASAERSRNAARRTRRAGARPTVCRHFPPKQA